MGDMADMMLDGTMCSHCGVYIGTDNGFPTPCPECAGDDLEEPNKIKCHYCDRKIHPSGIEQHLKAKHNR